GINQGISDAVEELFIRTKRADVQGCPPFQTGKRCAYKCQGPRFGQRIFMQGRMNPPDRATYKYQSGWTCLQAEMRVDDHPQKELCGDALPPHDNEPWSGTAPAVHPRLHPFPPENGKPAFLFLRLRIFRAPETSGPCR